MDSDSEFGIVQCIHLLFARSGSLDFVIKGRDLTIYNFPFKGFFRKPESNEELVEECSQSVDWIRAKEVHDD
jgi:hypothetical protein